MSAHTRSRVRSFAWKRCLFNSLLAGLVLGVAGRVAMRLAALESAVPSGASVGGSLEVILFGIAVGAPPSLALGIARQQWRIPRGCGMAAAAALFLPLMTWQPPAAASALTATPDRPLLTLLFFTIAFLAYGWVLELQLQASAKGDGHHHSGVDDD